MLKKISLLLFVCTTFCTPFAFAQNEKIISETVKIISYNLTANNHVIEKSLASGTLISEDGLILTNNHVVMDENNEPYEAFAICMVTDKQSKPNCLYTASLVAKEKSTDMAILQINSEDILGNSLPKFQYLDYQNNSLPEVSDTIVVDGFPGIGGKTLTTTEGQVSGYEEREGITHLKTDTTISAGNSGGTAKNSTGNFIGVPSYLRSNLTTLGYIIPLHEVENWITDNLEKEPQIDETAVNLLNELLAKKYQVRENQHYTSDFFPFYEIDIPSEWDPVFMNKTNLILNKQVEGENLTLKLSTEILPYDITDDFLDYLLKRIEKYKTYYTNYQRDSIKLHGQEAIRITYDFADYRNHYVIFTFENVLFTYNYQLSLTDFEETAEEIGNLIETLNFADKTNNTNPYRQNFTQNNPAIILKTSGNFYIAPILDSQEEAAIVNIYNPESFEQSFNLKEGVLEKDSWDLSIEEISKADIKQKRYSNPNFKLINRSDEVWLDGLQGYAYTYSYQGEDYNQTRKKTNVVVFMEEKYFRFTYDDLENNYEKNIGEVVKTLENFQYLGLENSEHKGRYKLPTFQDLFEDIQYHVYEKQISVLVDKEILEKEKKYFYPESEMKRIQALEAILNAQIYEEEEKGSKKTKTALEDIASESLFTDINQTKYGQLTNYALENGILTKNNLFHPNQGVTLAETLKILCKTFELPIWTPPYSKTIKWYVPYIYKGRSLGVIPAGLSFDSILTKGEFANLLYNFMLIVAEQSDF